MAVVGVGNGDDDASRVGSACACRHALSKVTRMVECINVRLLACVLVKRRFLGDGEAGSKVIWRECVPGRAYAMKSVTILGSSGTQ